MLWPFCTISAVIKLICALAFHSHTNHWAHNKQELLVSPVSTPSRIQVFTALNLYGFSRQICTRSMRVSSWSTPLNQEWWQSLVADETHFLLFSWDLGAAHFCVCYPSIKNTAPVRCLPYDPSLFNALQLVSTQLCWGPWKYLSLLKYNNTAPFYHRANVSIPPHLSMLNEARKTSCQETED